MWLYISSPSPFYFYFSSFNLWLQLSLYFLPFQCFLSFLSSSFSGEWIISFSIMAALYNRAVFPIFQAWPSECILMSAEGNDSAPLQWRPNKKNTQSGKSLHLIWLLLWWYRHTKYCLSGISLLGVMLGILESHFIYTVLFSLHLWRVLESTLIFNKTQQN